MEEPPSKRDPFWLSLDRRQQLASAEIDNDLIHSLAVEAWVAQLSQTEKQERRSRIGNTYDTRNSERFQIFCGHFRQQLEWALIADPPRFDEAFVEHPPCPVIESTVPTLSKTVLVQREDPYVEYAGAAEELWRLTNPRHPVPKPLGERPSPKPKSSVAEGPKRIIRLEDMMMPMTFVQISNVIPEHYVDVETSAAISQIITGDPHLSELCVKESKE